MYNELLYDKDNKLQIYTNVNVSNGFRSKLIEHLKEKDSSLENIPEFEKGEKIFMDLPLLKVLFSSG